jgi:hypothetical protein
MLRIAFQSNQLSMTGTEVALYDYARHNEEILGNKSIIIYDSSNPNNQANAIEKFSERFDVIPYEKISSLDSVLERTNSNLLYAIKSGRRDAVLSMKVPTMVHAVFPTNPHQIHGAAYAFISDWLSRNCSNGKIPCVPHIVDLPNIDGNLRESLGIPPNSLVIGGYGGRNSFDIGYAISAVKRQLSEDSDIHFLFMNFEKFLDHPRAIFLEGTTDMDLKVKFINTCDAMLHARLQGESFGLACGEFSIRNKPVMTYRHGKHTHHIDMLGNKGLYYDDEESLIQIFNQLPSLLDPTVDWDCYSDTCNPRTVMQTFDEVLIQPALRNPRKDKPQVSMNWRDQLSYLRFKWQMHKHHHRVH